MLFTDKQAQPSNDSCYTQLRSGSGIMSYYSSDENYHHLTAKSELISQSAVL